MIEAGPTKPRTAAYLRVSTVSQDAASQRREIERWLERHNIAEVQWHTDEGKSGTTLERPAFRDLQKAVFQEEIDTVVLYSLDRFSRTMIDGMIELHRWREYPVKIVFVRDNLTLEPGNPIGDVFIQVMISMKLAFAEAERERLRERTMDGMSVAREKQRHAYNWRKLGFSYTKIAKMLKCTKAQAEKMACSDPNKAYWGGAHGGTRKSSPERALQLLEAGLTYTEVAATLKVGTTTLCRYVAEAKELRRLAKEKRA